MPHLDPEEMSTAVADVITDPVDVRILVLMHETTCQSEVAKRLGVTQGFVRHRFIRSLDKMRLHEKLLPYVEVFDLISANLNILREVQRPNWENKVIRIVD
jgi:hypothetical protein